MSLVIILAFLALALVAFIAFLVSRLIMADSVQFEADSESEPEVLPTLTSSMDARIFARPVQSMRAVKVDAPTQIVEIGAMPIEAYRTAAPISTRNDVREMPTDRLPAMTPNRRAVIESLRTIALDAPDEIAPLTPNQRIALADTEWARDTQIDPSPYGQGRCPKTGRKRGANGRWIAE